MKKSKIYSDAAELIAGKILGTLTPEEEAAFSQWLARSEENRRTFGDIRTKMTADPVKPYHRPEAIAQAWKRTDAIIRSSRRRRTLRRTAAGVAAAAVLVACGVLIFNRPAPQDTASIYIRPNISTEYPSVTLPDGRTMEITSGTGHRLHVDSLIRSMAASDAGNGLISAQQPDDPERFNTIFVPRGSMVAFTLPDGTHVNMNSGSELRYPIDFRHDRRDVYVDGEVYFDVASDPARPMTVHAPEGVDIKVIGTAFNVTAYGSDPSVVTTLARGEVEVEFGGQVQTLAPDQQLVFDKAGRTACTRDVDAGEYTGWTEGKFIFHDQPLDYIMARIAIWYDVDIAYSDDSLRELRFSGDLERYDDLATLLSMLEKVTKIRIDASESVTIDRRQPVE